MNNSENKTDKIKKVTEELATCACCKIIQALANSFVVSFINTKSEECNSIIIRAPCKINSSYERSS